MPADFPVRAANRTIDYDWVTISGEKYLLPAALGRAPDVSRKKRKFMKRAT
ncbi:MAG: hypothetical protein WKF71_11820 [Pyrinomonadaceae bacterium]